MKILMIDREIVLGEQLTAFFESHKMRVLWISNLEEGLHHLEIYGTDLLLLDLMCAWAHEKGAEKIISTLRRDYLSLPIIILGSPHEQEEAIHCLDWGADDFLRKPFDFIELLARIKTLVRRVHGHAQPSVEVGALRVDLNQHLAFLGNSELPLTRMEYELLEFMALRSEYLLTRETLLNHLYGGLEEPDPKIIDVFVCKIRRKMNELYKGGAHIETVWGRGYKLTCGPC